MGRVLWFLWSVLIITVFLSSSVQASRLKESGKIKQVSYASGELLVKFKKGANLLTTLSLHQFIGAKVITIFEIVEGLQHVKTSGLSTEEALSYYNHHPMVAYAEPNYIYSIEEEGADDIPLPNDPKFSELWNLHNVGQSDANGTQGINDADIDAPVAWLTTTGDSHVVVAVIDTGIDYSHEDLSANMWINEREIPGNGKDDDGNGYKDDIYGYDFCNRDGDPFDDNEHGTHVSGIIAAAKDNQKGIVGVAPSVRLMAIKFLGEDGGGLLSNAVLGIEYAIKMGAKILNNSWGGGGFSQALYDAIAVANENQIVFTAASGNDGRSTDDNPHYPSSYKHPNVISVGGTTNQDVLAGFSNYGLKSVHLLAPGKMVLSSIPGNRYDVMEGTSMATPHISGIAALILSREPELSAEQVRERLIKTSDEIISVRRKVMSGGRVNAYNAIHNIIPPKAGLQDPGDWIEVAHAVSTPHNYPDNMEKSWTVHHPGATLLKIYFSKFDTEAGYDFVRIMNKNGIEADAIDGKMDPFWSFIIEGDTANIQFKSDTSINQYGFDIEKYAYSSSTDSK